MYSVNLKDNELIFEAYSNSKLAKNEHKDELVPRETLSTKPVRIKPDMQKWKDAALKFFVDEGGWSHDDNPIKQIQNATTWEQLNSGCEEIALDIGDRKGYGAEGIGALHEEFIKDIDKLAGVINYYYHYGDETGNNENNENNENKSV